MADTATGEMEGRPRTPGRNPATAALARKGRLKGGKARAAKPTPEQRSAAAKQAARARWGESG